MPNQCIPTKRSSSKILASTASADNSKTRINRPDPHKTLPSFRYRTVPVSFKSTISIIQSDLHDLAHLNPLTPPHSPHTSRPPPSETNIPQKNHPIPFPFPSHPINPPKIANVSSIPTVSYPSRHAILPKRGEGQREAQAQARTRTGSERGS
ncbi:uncharacterized protein RSE6_05625 [Rhynchosporium secalis]|uniref:Uncharacterized protein n=1 Tax=Rhynchosporium secalis TaxID=38038 RepID=A0A1E1M9G9_RHYSE|nr:uncharacterized protein RSE6_05625 [Rhynchosporium secalis]